MFSPWRTSCLPVKTTASVSLDYNVAWMWRPLAAVWRLYTIYTHPLLNLQITKFKLTSKSVLLQHGRAHVLLHCFPHSLHDLNSVKILLSLKSTLDRFMTQCFSNVLRGRVAGPEQSQNRDLRRKGFPPDIHRNTHTHTHTQMHATEWVYMPGFLKECHFPHGRLALPVTGWHASLFSTEGEKLKEGIKGADNLNRRF